MKPLSVLLTTGLVFSVALQAQTTYYVSTIGNDTNTGTSWALAFQTLQHALAIAGVNGDQIWVARGTYYPDEGTGQTNDNRDASFNLKNGVALYGGFVGTEGQLSQRNWQSNGTALSGDLMQNDGASFTNYDDNAFQVVRNNGINNTAVLDGFSLRSGNANGSSPAERGGGMYNQNSSAPTVSNCTFVGNKADFGGGMYNFNLSNPVLTNCTFSENFAGVFGGGIYDFNSTPSLTNCMFFGNITNLFGGGMYNNISSPSITNCTFSGNKQNGSAGGVAIFNNNSSPSLTNCILWGNAPGSQISNIGDGPSIVTFSIIQGGHPGTGNLNTDPRFVDAAAGNLRLQGSSPAINAGNNAANNITTDLDGNPRIVGVIDMGAYEYQYTVFLPLTIVSLKGVYQDEQSMLHWSTMNEFNVQKFVVERSINDADFSAVGVRTAHGSLNGNITNYEFIDQLGNVAGSSFYYRLKIIDNDGKTYYSRIILIRKSKQVVNAMTFLPNPVTSHYAQVIITSGTNENIEIRIIDLIGKTVGIQYNKVSTGVNSILVEGLSKLKNGVYLLLVVKTSEINSIRFVLAQE